MSMTDPIADMLTRLRNANMAGHERVEISASKLKLEIARVLSDEGFIRSYRLMQDGKQGIIRIYLKYGANNKEKAITNLKRISTPGRRVYANSGRLPRVFGDLGIAILSTSNGVKTSVECRRAKVGGEVLCHVW